MSLHDAVSELAIDLADSRSFTAGFPHSFFTWLRAHAPLYWHDATAATPDGEGFWVLSRHADVDAVLMDPRRYSSDSGGGRAGGGTAIKDEPTAGQVLNHTDDPRHRRLRELVNKGFTVKAVSALEDELRRRTRDILSGVRVGESFDFVRRIAREIPTQAICLVLGVPERDRTQLADWVDAGIEAESSSVIAADYASRLRRYAQSLIDTRRAAPAGDIFSTIVHARLEPDGAHLSDRELRSFFTLLFPAGAETTTRALAGDKVTVWEMSANRDERVFEAPFSFDVARTPKRHASSLAGEIGDSYCISSAASLRRYEYGNTVTVTNFLTRDRPCPGP